MNFASLKFLALKIQNKTKCINNDILQSHLKAVKVVEWRSVFTSPCHLQWALLHLHPPPRAADYLPADPRTRPQRGAGLAPGWRCNPPSWRSCRGWSWHWLTEKNPARAGETKTLHTHVRKSCFQEEMMELIHNWRTKVFWAACGFNSAPSRHGGFTSVARTLIRDTWLLCYLQVSSYKVNSEKSV